MKNLISIDKNKVSDEIAHCCVAEISKTSFMVIISEFEMKNNHEDSSIRKGVIINEFCNNNISFKEFDDVNIINKFFTNFDENQKIINLENYKLITYSFQIKAISIDELINVLKTRFENINNEINKAKK